MMARTMKRTKLSGISSGALVALAMAAAFSLAGCSDIDSMLFGSEPSEQNDQAAATSYSAPSQAPEASYTPAPAPAFQPNSVSMVSAPVATITPLVIAQGGDTGTAVNKTVAALRSKVVALQGAIRQNAQQLADLRNTGAAASASYYTAKGIITARLQVGTTRGNPELVGQWNQAQASLDQMAANINGLNALAKAVAEDSSTSHYTLDQISATFNVSGAVDEDHRQLNVLEDETNQTIVLIDRLLKEAADDVQRQTAYVANERANLTTLAGAIKNGVLYGADIGAPVSTGAVSRGGNKFAAAGAPMAVIHFDRAGADNQQILYTALRQTLQAKPDAAFSVVAVSPARGNAAAVQLAQTTAHRHAEEVLRSLTDMGVLAYRLSVSSATDPSVYTSEVRVFAR
jgi:hypothetical protein